MKRVKRATLKKIHNQAVDRIANKPEILGIDGLSSKTLLYEPFKFPELRRKGQETGDIIFLYSPSVEEWVILVIEVQIGAYRSGANALFKLKMSLNYLKKHWQKWFRSVGLDLPKGYTLWLETAFVSYAGKALWEQPFVRKKRIQIL